MARSDVLIVGAGPTGLVLALWLSKLGLKPRVSSTKLLSQERHRARWRSMRVPWSFYRQLDLTDAVIERGHKVPGR